MIIFEKPKCKLFLTFSAIISDDQAAIDGLCKCQDKIYKKFIEIESIPKEIIFERNNLYAAIKGSDRIIYSYPKERMHFSIVNYGAALLDDIESFDNFEFRMKNYQQTADYRRQIQLMVKFREQFYSFFSDRISFNIKNIYIDEKSKNIQNSIALQVFPERNDFFDIINKIKPAELLAKSHEKQQKEKYFSINVFRFIDAENYHDLNIVDSENCLLSYLFDLNQELSHNPINIKIRPQIVISDPYLANKNYLDINQK